MTDEALGPVLELLTLAARHGQRHVPRGEVWRYGSWAELVLDRGRSFEPVGLVDVVPQAWRGAPTTCYVSAALWSIDAGVAYVEGWAATALLALGTEHAWCADGTATALDPTWPPGRGTAYVGVPFSADYRRRVRTPSLLTAEHAGGLDLLRAGVPDGALVDVGHPLPPP
jgi:hypothetical protein